MRHKGYQRDGRRSIEPAVIAPLSQARATLIRSLHRKKGRIAEGAFLAEGERLLSELPANGGSVRWFFAEPDNITWIEARFPDAAIYEIERSERSLFATEHAQGVGAVVEISATPTIEELAARMPPLLLLDSLADPGNVGTIIRTAEWFGMGGVLLGPGTVDLYNPKTVRATMGAVFRLPVLEEVDPQMVLQLGLPLIALDASADEYLGETTLPRRGIYIIGSEAHGVSPELLGESRPVAIRGGGQVESLNAAIAAAILCYELSRVQ
jgi:RNA methyltransferase, TrmH family